MIRILKYGEVSKDAVFARMVPQINVEQIVSQIIDRVRQDGDKALYEYCEKFDGAKLDSLQVSQEELNEAYRTVDPKFIEILKKAAKNIRDFHECQKRDGFALQQENGVVIGQKIIPVDRAGLYVPGGTGHIRRQC